jgi:hypothetical protein
MTEIDFETEKVRSKPATGAPPAGALGLDPTGSPLTGSEHAPSMLERFSSLTCEPGTTPRPPSRSARPLPKKTPGGVPVEA